MKKLNNSPFVKPIMEDEQSVFDVAKRKGAMNVIYSTGAHGDVRFSELKSHLSVSEPTIATRLDELEEAGLIDRTFYGEKPMRVEYSLPPAGEELYRHLSPVFEWAAEQVEPGRPPDRDRQQQGQSQTCLFCETANGSGTDSDGNDTTWYRTVDGLINVLAKTHAMEVVVQVGAEGPIRYSEIKDRLDITTDAAVSTRLDQFQEAGLMDRRSYDEIPPRVEYSLTQTGHELAERLQPLLEWGGTRNTDQPPV